MTETKLGPKNEPSKKSALMISSFSALVAGLCCFSPVVIVLLGLGTASFAGGLADTLYGEYKWYFRAAGLLLLAAAYGYWYWQRSRGCTLDERARLRKKMLNLFLISLFAFILIYIIWLYVIVEFFGIQLGIWETPTWFGG